MKKFYLHNGIEQTGPFDLEELRTQNIIKQTSVWHEGLSEWTTAENVEEINDLLSSTPPPFTENKKTPPPINSTRDKSTTINNTTSPSVQKKKKSYTRAILILFVCVVAIGGVLIVINNSNIVSGITSPYPTIVTSRANGNDSGLFNARTTVYATVTNNGGSGEVIVTFYVYQDNNVYSRDKTIYLLAGESQDLQVTFEEVDYISGEIAYDVSAAPR